MVEKSGAGNETRTRDPNLGKVVLYQLSYSRKTIYSSFKLVDNIFRESVASKNAWRGRCMDVPPLLKKLLATSLKHLNNLFAIIPFQQLMSSLAMRFLDT
jgi:hypothetical protein